MAPHWIFKYFEKKPTKLLVNKFLSKIICRLNFKQVTNSKLISTLVKILF